jgi:hypothetical protein
VDDEQVKHEEPSEQYGMVRSFGDSVAETLDKLVQVELGLDGGNRTETNGHATVG